MKLNEEEKRLLDIELNNALKQEEKEKIFSDEDLQRQKKYLIEGIIEDGESLSAEMINKNVDVDYESPYKKMVDYYYELNHSQSEENYKEIEVNKLTQKKSFWKILGEMIFK